MKIRSLATVVILLCSFLLTPGFAKAQDNDWYQGRRGHWAQENNQWRFRDADGDVYRQQGDRWEWSHPNAAAADPDQWYQGRRGHWIQENNAWRFRDADGDEYRNEGGRWGWSQSQAHPNVEQAGPETWYQGHRGRWVKYPSGWRFRTADGRVYRQQRDGGGWGWFDARGHGGGDYR
jgi:hypothetical protein